MEKIYNFYLITTGCIGGFISYLVGGYTMALESLIIFMILDYVLAVANSLIFKTSPKTEDGKLSSRVSIIGIYKKCLMLIIVMVAHRIDLTFSINYVKDSVCTALIVNEIISILETYKSSGLKSPKILDTVISQIQGNKNE